MTTIRQQLEDIEARGLIHPSKGAIVIDTRVRDYPDVDLHFLAQLLDDYLFDWSDAIDEYVETIGGKE